MADFQDVLHAEQQAVASQRYCENYCDQLEDGQGESARAVVPALAMLALCDRIAAAAIRLDYALGRSDGS
jgi:hypothetical protein